MTGATVALIALVAVGVGVGLLLLYGASGRSNSWPALGTNLKQDGFGMVWWKRTWLGQRGSPSVPEVDEALGPHYDILTVDHELDRAYHHRHAHDQPPPASSWMDEPGAMERDGLVDAEEPGEERTDGGSR
jgi:hypothetical protein